MAWTQTQSHCYHLKALIVLNQLLYKSCYLLSSKYVLNLSYNFCTSTVFEILVKAIQRQSSSSKPSVRAISRTELRVFSEAHFVSCRFSCLTHNSPITASSGVWTTPLVYYSFLCPLSREILCSWTSGFKKRISELGWGRKVRILSNEYPYCYLYLWYVRSVNLE